MSELSFNSLKLLKGKYINDTLLSSSIHPVQCTRNVPYSLSLRIVRICTDPVKREQRFEELKQLLIARGYRQKMLDSAISRARAVPRQIALRKVAKPNSLRRPIFAVTYDPRLPPIPNIMAKHFRSMTHQDSYLKEIFTEPPLTAFRRQRNLRDMSQSSSE